MVAIEKFQSVIVLMLTPFGSISLQSLKHVEEECVEARDLIDFSFLKWWHHTHWLCFSTVYLASIWSKTLGGDASTKVVTCEIRNDASFNLI